MKLYNIIAEEIKKISLDKAIEDNEIKPMLHPKFWTNNELNSVVRKQLLKIVNSFWKYMDLPWVKIKDITFTGSLANFNYTPASDVDLHLIICFDHINDDLFLVREFIKSKTDLWNQQNKIKIYNHDVEIYVQNISEEHMSTGVYSILKNKWVVKPKYKNVELDKKYIKRKIIKYISEIDKIEELYENKEYSKVLKNFDILWDKIKNLRKSGLKNDGVLSYNNIIFKILRRIGSINRLIKIKNNTYDKILSLNN